MPLPAAVKRCVAGSCGICDTILPLNVIKVAQRLYSMLVAVVGDRGREQLARGDRQTRVLRCGKHAPHVRLVLCICAHTCVHVCITHTHARVQEIVAKAGQ